LAVVDHEQQMLLPDLGNDEVERVALGAQPHPERSRGLLHHQRPVRDRGELDEANAALECLLAPRCELERETRLTCAARARECQQPGPLERGDQLSELSLAADEARQLM